MFRHVAPPAARMPLLRVHAPPHRQRVIDGVVLRAAATEEPLYGTLVGDADPQSYVTLVRVYRCVEERA